MKKKKIIINIVAFVLQFCYIFLQELFMPKYMSEIPRG